MRKLQFWYEFASTYSYLAAMRIETLAAERGVELQWKPFLLGPIFAAQGWHTSPFNIYPAKGSYMQRDMQRLCAERGLPFRLPDPFPQNSLHAARVALVGAEEGWAPAFSRAVYMREFGEGRQLTDPVMLAEALAEAGQDAEAVLQRAQALEVKQALRAQTEAAQALGIFGVPSFVTDDGEMFWGDDRLEQALSWQK